MVNHCAPIWASRPRDHFPIFSARNVMLGELLAMFLLFLAIDIYLQWRKRTMGPNVHLDHSYHQWKDSVGRCFGDHVIALGFTMAFSPYVFEIILSIVHLLIFVGSVVGELRKWEWKERLEMSMRLVNVTLMLCAMIGIGRCGSEGGVCTDILYNP